MSLRNSAVPLVLVGGIAAFVGTQIIERAQSSPTKRVPTVVAPQGAPDSSARLLAQEVRAYDEITIQPSVYDAPIVDTASVRRILRDEASGTYLSDLLEQNSNALVRWPDRGRSMRVWIQRSVSLPDWDANYAIVAERAFEEWQRAGFPLRFDMIIEPRDVDIEILWIDRFPPEEGQKIGNAKKVRDQHGWLVSTQIQIATHDSAGRALPPSIIAGTARHEIGHVLGLGHSRNPADVMYPESHTTVISEADRRTLRLLYMLPPGRMP